MRRGHLNKTIEGLPLLNIEFHRAMTAFATCRIQNCYPFSAYVVLMATEERRNLGGAYSLGSGAELLDRILRRAFLSFRCST